VSVCLSPIPDRDGGALVVVQFTGVDDSGAIERTLRLEQTLARIVDELGRLHMTELVAGDDDGLTPMPTCPLPDSLSTRRSEVARLMLTGRSIPQVAAALDLSEHTVRNHLKAVYRVLGVSSRSEFLRRYHA
jgi:DNA-binding NarL/FixJ family response regulator